MSVAEEIRLPAQPTSGGVDYLPLGGDGFTAPHSMYTVRNMNIVGDASGGQLQAKVTQDRRFSAICTLMSIGVVGPAAAVVFRAEIAHAPQQNSRQVFQIGGTGVFTELPSALSQALWSPSPILDLAHIQVKADNSGVGVDLLLNALIYNFDIRVAEKVPLNVILASLPRSGSLL